MSMLDYLVSAPAVNVLKPVTPKVPPTVALLVTPRPVLPTLTASAPATTAIPVGLYYCKLLVAMSKSPSIPVAPVTPNVPSTVVY